MFNRVLTPFFLPLPISYTNFFFSGTLFISILFLIHQFISDPRCSFFIVTEYVILKFPLRELYKRSYHSYATTTKIRALFKRPRPPCLGRRGRCAMMYMTQGGKAWLRRKDDMIDTKMMILDYRWSI